MLRHTIIILKHKACMAKSEFEKEKRRNEKNNQQRENETYIDYQRRMEAQNREEPNIEEDSNTFQESARDDRAKKERTDPNLRES